MKITVLAENLVYSSALSAEHGLSLLIEDDESIRHLVDTGQGGVLLQNMSALGIAPDSIDAAYISHGHYDHTGGLYSLLSARTDELMVYAHRDIFFGRYADDGVPHHRYIGVPKTQAHYEQAGANFYWIDRFTHLKNVTVLPAIPAGGASSRFDTRLLKKKDTSLVQDDFTDELTFIFETRKGKVIVSGCAHNGIAEIIENAALSLNLDSVYAVIGGTHLVAAPQEYIERTGDLLERYNVQQIGFCHCTGFDAAAGLRCRFQDKFRYLWTGRSIEL